MHQDVLKMLTKEKQKVDIALTTLNATAHSLAYSYLLGFKAQDLKLDDVNAVRAFLNVTTQFIKEADPAQIALVPRPFTDALRVYVDIMKRDRNYLPLINILKRCVSILQGTPQNRGMLTFAHCDLVYCCVETFCYHQALPLVDYDIIQVQGLSI